MRWSLKAMNYLTQLIPISILFILIYLAAQQKQLLSALLILEMIIIIIIFLSSIYVSKITTEIFYIITILTFAATEASLGLACLVIIVRSYGSDILKILSNIIC